MVSTVAFEKKRLQVGSEHTLPMTLAMDGSMVNYTAGCVHFKNGPKTKRVRQ